MPMYFEEMPVRCGETSATVSATRGGMVTGLKVRGRDLLYFDRATFEDPEKSVRGGIPILFPFAGRLDGDKFLPAGTTIKQHGFGRNKPWKILSRGEEHVALGLEPDDWTMGLYPYLFSARQTVQAVPHGIRIDLLIRNRGDKPMPVSPGWHPYFRCPSAYKPKITGDLPKLDPARLTPAAEFDFGLPVPSYAYANFRIPQTGHLQINMAPELKHLQFWSQPGKDFVCIEPFVGPNNTVNTDRRIDIPPGGDRTLWLRIELLPD